MKKLFLSLPILIFVLVYNVYSQDISFRPFLGVSANYIILTGSFDGESFFETENEIIFVPKIEPNFGFGVQGGIRFFHWILLFIVLSIIILVQMNSIQVSVLSI